MLVRRNGNVRLYLNTTPGSTLSTSSDSIEYPNSKKYFVWNNGSIVKRTDNLKTAEDTFSDESDIDGRIIIGKTEIPKSRDY